MAAPSAGTKSLKEYLKRYESNIVEEKKTKKKKKKTKPEATGVLVVDEDPVWQKPVNLDEEENDESAEEEKPQVNEDIEVRRMKRLEQLRARRAYNAVAEDGSGWVSLSPKRTNINDQNSDISPPHRERARNDTPSPEPGLRTAGSGKEDDLSPPRQRKRHHSPSPEAGGFDSDLSLPCETRARNDMPSPLPEFKPPNKDNNDLSPPQQQRKRYHFSSPEPDTKPADSIGLNSDLSPPRKQRMWNEKPFPDSDLSPPWQRRKRHCPPSSELDMKPAKSMGLNPDMSPPRRTHPGTSEDHGRRKYGMPESPDISPPRRVRRGSPHQDGRYSFPEPDLSPPRKNRKDVGSHETPTLSPQRFHGRSTANDNSRASLVSDRENQKGSPSPASVKEKRKAGLISGRDIREEIMKTKKDELSRFKKMDPSISGRGAEPVFRDKIKGERISKEEYLKSKQKGEEKPKEKKLEWGKGLAQKREAEARLQELELEKDKPFARTRDDPELDNHLKERVRWGDPMAHLVKKKRTEPALLDLGDNEKMKESGFIIPQGIPSHSWLKRGFDAAPNRYGIRPGRHWDGVDRSNGFEKKMFQRKNEKEATQREAYLWSVSDM